MNIIIENIIIDVYVTYFVVRNF